MRFGLTTHGPRKPLFLAASPLTGADPSEGFKKGSKGLCLHSVRICTQQTHKGAEKAGKPCSEAVLRGQGPPHRKHPKPKQATHQRHGTISKTSVCSTRKFQVKRSILNVIVCTERDENTYESSLGSSRRTERTQWLPGRARETWGDRLLPVMPCSAVLLGRQAPH